MSKIKVAFQSHRIALNHHQNDNPHLLSNSAVWIAVKKSIERFVLKNPTQQAYRAVDLGCMEGGYSIELAKMGFHTTGIDARKHHLLKANIAKLQLNLKNLNFVKDDVRHLSQYGHFDLTLCFGIFYHLDDPVQFLKTLYAQSRVLILHTFYAPEKDWKYELHSFLHHVQKNIRKNKKKLTVPSFLEKGAPYIQHVKSYRLSRLTEQNGYKGRWYQEWKPDRSREDIERMPGAAYNNHRSFWLCKKDLISALYQAGFSSVYEQLDDIRDLNSKYPEQFYGRTLLVAVRDEPK